MEVEDSKKQRRPGKLKREHLSHDVNARLVSCPPRARLQAINGLVNKMEFLGLIPQMVEDQ